MLELIIKGSTLGELHSKIVHMYNEINPQRTEEVVYGENVVPATVPVGMSPNGNVVKDTPSIPVVPGTVAQAPTVMEQPIEPSQPVVPVSNAAPVGQPAAVSGEVDSRGFPHDSRIHSNPPKQNSDGTWKSRRGAEQPKINEVEAELVAKGYGKQVAPAKTVAPFGSMSQEQYQNVVKLPTQNAPAIPAVPTSNVPNPMPQAPNMSFAPPAAVTNVLPPNTYTEQTFRDNLLKVISDLANEGKVTPENIQQWKQENFAGKELHQWNQDVDVCNGLFGYFVQQGFLNKA